MKTNKKRYLKERPKISDGLLNIKKRMDKVDNEHRRQILVFNYDIALGQAASGPMDGSRNRVMESFAEGTSNNADFVKLGDQSVVIKSGKKFPGKLPSEKKGLKYDQYNFAEDLASFYKQLPAVIHPDEDIIGEINWAFSDLRPRIFPENEELEVLGEIAASLGSGGYPVTHTCADLSIGIKKGWGKILEELEDNGKKFKKSNNNASIKYNKASIKICRAIIEFIKKYAEEAKRLGISEKELEQKERYLKIHKICNNITTGPPRTFHEGVQWVWFYIMVERILLEGNGYGRIDQYLYPLFKKDIKKGLINRQQARELIAELYLKYATFYVIGGRNKNGDDATNELSWICVEAYDMTGTMIEFGVMWHSDIDKDFFRYACAVVARHGNGSPALVNQDVLRESEIYYGVKPEDAYNVAYAGCFWYCIPGKEWCCHDTLSVSGIKIFMNALKIAFKMNITDFSQLWNLYQIYLRESIKAMKELTDWQLKKIPDVYPELTTSLMTHDCARNGKDITDLGVPYNCKVVQFSGIANIADSMLAIKKSIFEEKRITLEILEKALDADFKNYEDIRQLLLNNPKFGNDIEEVDSLAVEIADNFREILSGYETLDGHRYRPAFFSWAGHAYAYKLVGATPDGRKKEDPIAQGSNPMHGRNTQGLTATARSVSKLDFNKNAGGPLQLELDPSIIDSEDPSRLIESITVPYFEMGGLHVYFNIVSEKTLKDAMVNPEKYQHLVVRVTGFSAHYVQLDKKIQEEIIS